MQYADGTTTERELRLARDRSGDLLLRDATVRMKPFSVWGDSTGHWRTGASTTWRRIPALGGVSTAKLGEEERPPPHRRDGTTASTPGETGRSCADAPQRLVALSQRLLATLPRGIEVVRFMPRQAPAGGPRDCTLLVVEVTFEGPSPQALEAVDAIVRRGSDVRSVDRLPLAEGDPKPRRALRVTLQ